MGSQEGKFPLGEEYQEDSRIDSRVSGMSIKFDDGHDDSDGDRGQYFRPGRFCTLCLISRMTVNISQRVEG